MKKVWGCLFFARAKKKFAQIQYQQKSKVVLHCTTFWPRYCPKNYENCTLKFVVMKKKAFFLGLKCLIHKKVLLKVKIACLHSEKIHLMSDCQVAVDATILKNSNPVCRSIARFLSWLIWSMTQYYHFHKYHKLHKDTQCETWTPSKTLLFELLVIPQNI